MGEIDFVAQGLLEGLDGRAREARLHLLEELEADGVPLEELRRAVAEDRLALLPVERYLAGGGERYSAREVAEQVGIELDQLRFLRQAIGLPLPDEEERVFTDADVEAAQRVKTFLDAGLPAEGMLEVTRVMGVAIAQVTAASRALIVEAVRRGGDDERTAALRYLGAARTAKPMIGPTLEYFFDLHLREQLRNEAVGHTELVSGGLASGQQITVGFADLVGFTRFGERLGAEDLGELIGRLNQLANEVAVSPVRLVKMIGDAAMLVSTDTAALVDAALALVDAAKAEGDGFPELRAGVALGVAVPRSGDWYGRPVNLASRITDRARPGSVLVSAEVRDALGEKAGYEWSFAGPKRLKGIQGEVRVYRCRRAPPAPR